MLALVAGMSKVGTVSIFSVRYSQIVIVRFVGNRKTMKYAGYFGTVSVTEKMVLHCSGKRNSLPEWFVDNSENRKSGVFSWISGGEVMSVPVSVPKLSIRLEVVSESQ